MYSSIIISTYNRAPLLRRLLLSLSNQTLKPDKFEVVVVDDGSNDDTALVCKEMIGKIPNLRYLPTGKNLGLQRAQNLGVQAARGKHLLFTDDDCIAREDWAEALNAALERESIVGGAVDTTLSNFFRICHNIAQFYAFMPGQVAGYTDFIAGANMAFRRSVLEQIGGFYTDLKYSPDTEIVLRARSLGYSAFFEPRALVTHDPMRTSYVDIVKYAADHASATIHLRNRYRTLLRTPFVLRSPSMILAASPVIAFFVTSRIYFGNPRLVRYFWTIPVVFTLKLAWCWGASRGLQNGSKEQKK